MDAPCIQDAVEALDEVERAFVHVVGFTLLYKSLASASFERHFTLIIRICLHL